MEGLFGGGDDVEYIPPPSKEEEDKKIAARERNVRESRERFLARQATLGPIQLQAPTLNF